MDQELKQYLDARFAELATRSELKALEEHLNTLVEKTETNLLGAFYGWARPMEIRVDGMTKTVMGFDERLALAERRISELERKRPS
jgi:hypothetical protein